MPKVVDQAVHSKLASLLAAFDEILALEEPDGMLKRAAELALERIGLKRVGIFLLDRQRNAIVILRSRPWAFAGNAASLR